MFAALSICRCLHYAAAMALFGASVFVSMLAPRALAGELERSFRRLDLAAVLTIAVTAFLWLLLEAGMMGGGWPDMVQPDTIGAVLLDTSFGHVWQAHCVLSSGLVVVAVLRPGWPTCAAVALVLASLAFVGHAAMQTGPLGWLHRTNLAVHLLAGGFWLGGLLPLLQSMRLAQVPRYRHEAITALRRFSTLGHAAVAAVVFTGAVNAALIFGTTLFAHVSVYLVLLAAKAGLVVVMVGLAVFNRYWVVPRLRSRPDAAACLVRNSKTELALGIAVIGLVSLFGLLDPHANP